MLFWAKPFGKCFHSHLSSQKSPNSQSPYKMMNKAFNFSNFQVNFLILTNASRSHAREAILEFNNSGIFAFALYAFNAFQFSFCNLLHKNIFYFNFKLKFHVLCMFICVFNEKCLPSVLSSLLLLHLRIKRSST